MKRAESIDNLSAGCILRSDKRRDPEMGGGSRKIVSIAVSKKKGTRKLPVDAAYVVEDHGLQEDAHSGPWGRQVSFLAAESIEESRSKGLEVGFGDFAENIATEGVDWKSVPIGSRVQLGESVIVEITQIGKECHKKCAIYYQAGDCIMPREGVFARVLKGGVIRLGDAIILVDTKP
jgi:MOSC domain-containing protein YiiM